jgi:Fur family transcriptional regulator, zinc uptake regulator
MACNAAPAARAEAFERLAVRALREAGLRVTEPRLRIVRALGASNRPLTAIEILDSVRKSGERVDQVTVYRALATLQAVGAAHRIGVAEAYAACGLHEEKAHNTQHFVCDMCGCVTEVGLSDEAAHTIAGEARRLGFQTREIRLEVLGRCEHCRGNK